MNKVGIFALTTIAYLIAGKVGASLSIPPDTASVVWPASGIALALALRFGIALVAPGVALGSLLINLTQSSYYLEGLTLSSLALPVAICVAASLQTVAGYFLFKRFVGHRLDLTMPKAILGFILAVTMVGCLVSCTLSTAAFWALGIVVTNSYSVTWFTWWVGDAIGVLFFTPFLLILFTSDYALSNRQKLQVVLPSVFIFLVTWTLFLTSKNWQVKAIQLKVENDSLDIYRYIAEDLHASIKIFDAYDAFISSVPKLDRSGFERFSKSMLENTRLLNGVGWAEIIPHTQRLKTENAQRANGFQGFEFKNINANGEVIRAREKKEYIPILYLYPEEQFSGALGLDLAGDAHKSEMLARARLMNHTVASAPKIIEHEPESRNSVLLFRPIYSHDNQQFLGFISGSIPAEKLFANVLAVLEQTGFSLVLSDVTDSNNVSYLVQQEKPSLAGLPTFKYYLEFAERVYEVDLYASYSHVLPNRNWTSWFVLVAGFCIAALTQTFVLSIAGSHSRIKDEVFRKTQDLQKQTQLAEQASQAKSQFLSNMSHELRTPLNAIIGLVKLCLKTNLNAQQKHYLDRVSLASTTLLSLINQTLDHTKIEAGKMEIENEKFTLNYVLQKLHVVFEQTSQDKGLGFVIEVADGVPNDLIGDELRLEQILINLLGNAFKFTSEGQVALSVSLDENKWFVFDVDDTGCGIPIDYQQHMFAAFTQVDSSTSRVFGGTGLGLSISSDLAKMMGGHLSLVASDPAGSKFRVTLPLKVAENATMVEFMPSEVPPLVQPEQIVEQDETNFQQTTTYAEDIVQAKVLSGCVILLVEDNAINQLVAEGLLTGCGAEVIIANNGAEALTLLEQHDNIDVILMDVQMPVMDGYEATEKIRLQEQYADLPILAMTANVLEQDIAKCIVVGMNDHIAKPIDVNILVEKIQSVTHVTTVSVD